MGCMTNWCDLDDAYLLIFGTHPDLPTQPDAPPTGSAARTGDSVRCPTRKVPLMVAK